MAHIISTRTLVKLAAWGGVIVSTTGLYLQFQMIENFRQKDYYKDALRKLRSHPGAVHFLGEPIKDKRFKLTDPKNNNCDEKSARFCVPVSGTKDYGSYFFWAEKINDSWTVTRAELEIKSKPDARLVIAKSNS